MALECVQVNKTCRIVVMQFGGSYEMSHQSAVRKNEIGAVVLDKYSRFVLLVVEIEPKIVKLLVDSSMEKHGLLVL